jgi:hypothetical protein
MVASLATVDPPRTAALLLWTCLAVFWVGDASCSSARDAGARRGWDVAVAETSIELGLSRPLSGDSWEEDFDRGWSRSRGFGLSLDTGFLAAWGCWEAKIGWRGRAGEYLPWRGRLLEAWMGATGSVFEFGVGRRSLYWTPSVDAELLISPHPPPLDQFWFRIPRVAIPAVGGWLAGETFLGYLDDADREVPYPLLWGMRASWNPWVWLRLEAQRTIMMGGAGRGEKLKLKDIWDIFIGRGENLTEPPYPPSESDQKFAWQVVLHPTWLAPRLGLHDLEIFGTYAGEDAFRGVAPRAPAKAFGLRIHPSETAAISFAFARNTDDSQHWYHHKIYRSGYTYRGFWLGHPMGGDAMTWRGGLFLLAPDGSCWSFRLVREKRGYFWDRKGSFPHEAGGFWRWSLAVSLPVSGAEVAVALGGSTAWGGDLTEGRLPEGFAVVRLTLGGKGVRRTIDRPCVWGPPG